QPANKRARVVGAAEPAAGGGDGGGKRSRSSSHGASTHSVLSEGLVSTASTLSLPQPAYPRHSPTSHASGATGRSSVSGDAFSVYSSAPASH
ncbi:hypothetical protein ABTM66_18965, partial [Acinetobacter baumannii]